MDTMIIGVDHGNGNMKTAHTVFPCGYKMQETEPSSLFAKDIIGYGGVFYSLTPNRFSYQVDKTTDEKCFILTLFAVAKEIVARTEEAYTGAFNFAKDFPGSTDSDIILAVGLPPAHFEKQQAAFKAYFSDKAKDGIRFSYNGKDFRLRLISTLVYPQDFAAAIIYREDTVAKYRTVFCIDIGDGTVDLLALSNGMPDKETMISRELGMSILRERIIDDVINDYGMTLDGATIDDVLAGREVVIPKEIVDRIKLTTEEFAVKVVNQLHSKVPDFRIASTIFCGGGATLLKPYLIKTRQFGTVDFISEIHANAVGYEKIAEMSV